MTWSDPRPAPRFRRLAPEARAATLVNAGLTCLARGGITGFTIDNICAEAQASRGLIGHHFGAKDGLLTAVCAEAYRRSLAGLVSTDATAPDLAALIARAFAETQTNRELLKVWLALWGEIATNPALQATHRRHYTLYRAVVAAAISAVATDRGLRADAEALAVSLIALIDGLWLEMCIAPDLILPQAARQMCFDHLMPALGPLGTDARPAAIT